MPDRPAAGTMAAMSNMTIVLHGASGVQGAPVARRLLRDGHRVRAAVRHPDRAPAGCEPFPTDLTDPAALDRAYAGADAVVVQLPNVFDDTAIRQAEAVAAALGRSQVLHVVFNAGGPTGGRGLPYLEARTMLAKALEQGPFTAAIVEPLAPYMENLSAPWSAPHVNAGELAYPLPAEAPIPWVAIDDVAGRIADAVKAGEHGKLPICGPGPLTGGQAAAAVGAALGRPVRWRSVTPAEFGDRMRPYAGDGMADGVAALYAAMHAAPRPAPDPTRLRVGGTDLGTWAARQAWGEALAA
jgi:uncharacterized protein YbjT (DUF2867 family)